MRRPQNAVPAGDPPCQVRLGHLYAVLGGWVAPLGVPPWFGALRVSHMNHPLKSVVTTQVVRASASACRRSAAQADMRTCVWVDRCTLCQYPSTFVSVLATKRSETYFAPKLAVGGSNPQISPPHRYQATAPCALTRGPDDSPYKVWEKSGTSNRYLAFWGATWKTSLAGCSSKLGHSWQYFTPAAQRLVRVNLYW